MNQKFVLFIMIFKTSDFGICKMEIENNYFILCLCSFAEIVIPKNKERERERERER